VAESGEIPFATCDQDVKKMFSRDYTKKQRNRSIHEKVKNMLNSNSVLGLFQVGSSRIFDPTIYLTNYEESISNRKESSLRNFKGSGDILAHSFTKAERNVSSTIEQTQDLEIEHQDDVTADE